LEDSVLLCNPLHLDFKVLQSHGTKRDLSASGERDDDKEDQDRSHIHGYRGEGAATS